MILKRSKTFQKLLDFCIKNIDFLLNLRMRKSRDNLKILLIFKMILISLKAKVLFIVGQKIWAIYWISKNIAESLNKLNLINADLIYRSFSRNKIIHYGSIELLAGRGKVQLSNKSNKHVVTWFHISPNDKRLKAISYLNKHLDYLITPSPITKEDLVKSGFNKDKIEIIPVGVDLSHFKKYNKSRCILLKKKFNLPLNKVIIGSFQKDGEDWGDGIKPKFVKGPDIFCEVIRKLNEKFKVHVFLVGPSRGYVKKKLDEYHVPYTHRESGYKDIVNCYNVIDLYIIASRIEGGPLALPECMATGVPIVTTNVGMASYYIKNGIDGFITDIDNIDQLYEYAAKIIEDPNLKQKVINNGLKTVQQYSWEKIAEQYYYKVYEKLLND